MTADEMLEKIFTLPYDPPKDGTPLTERELRKLSAAVKSELQQSALALSVGNIDKMREHVANCICLNRDAAIREHGAAAWSNEEKERLFTWMVQGYGLYLKEGLRSPSPFFDDRRG